MFPKMVLVPIVALVSFIPTQSDAPFTVAYTRAIAEEFQIGQVTYRRAYDRNLSLQIENCVAADCFGVRPYGQVYSLHFELESYSNDDIGSSFALEPKGRLAVAIDLDEESELRLEASIDASLDSLTTGQFSRSLAILGGFQGPFGTDIMELSNQPFVLCREVDGVTTISSVRERLNTGGGFTLVSRSNGEDVERACGELFEATKNEPSRIRRTDPWVTELIRYTVEYRQLSRVGETTWAGPLAAVPPSVSYSKRPRGKDDRGASFEIDGDRRSGYTAMEFGVVRESTWGPDSVEVTALPMWILQWRLTQADESFAPNPPSPSVESNIVTIAVVPVSDPTLESDVATSTSVSYPDAALVDAVSKSVERSRRLSSDAILKAFESGRVWPAVGEWMIVNCEDRGGSYGMAPFPPTSPLSNSQEVCGWMMNAFESPE